MAGSTTVRASRSSGLAPIKAFIMPTATMQTSTMTVKEDPTLATIAGAQKKPFPWLLVAGGVGILAIILLKRR